MPVDVDAAAAGSASAAPLSTTFSTADASATSTATPAVRRSGAHRRMGDLRRGTRSGLPCHQWSGGDSVVAKDDGGLVGGEGGPRRGYSLEWAAYAGGVGGMGGERSREPPLLVATSIGRVSWVNMVNLEKNVPLPSRTGRGHTFFFVAGAFDEHGTPLAAWPWPAGLFVLQWDEPEVGPTLRALRRARRRV